MDITRAQQKALDDDLVSPANRLKIGKCNLRLSSNLNSKEPTLQVVLDALKLASFYKAFKITADVPEIYMQEFWVIASRHHSSLCQKFKDPPLEEEILSFIRELGHIVSGKNTALESLRLSLAQILWVIVDYFMAKDQSIPRRNKMFWHTARDDPIFTTIRVISKHHNTQIYGGFLSQHLTNQSMLESKAYKTYHAYATSEKIPKPKYVKNKADPESSLKKKSAQASEGKRVKTSTKMAKFDKKKQPATEPKSKRLTVLSEVALSEHEEMKFVTKRSKTQYHSSHASGSGADKGTGVSPGVPDVPTYDSEDEQISWKSSDEDDDDQDDDNDNEGNDDQDDDELTESDNDGDDLVHPKLSTFDEKEKQDKEDKEEEWSDDEAYDEETQDTPQTNVQGFISNMLNPNPDTSIDSILNLNTESTSLVDVPVTTNVEMPPLFFEDRVKALEDEFSKFMQTNPFAKAVSSIPDIVDKYIANKMNEAVKAAVQLQSDRLKEEAQAKNQDFLNQIDENMKKIIKEQVKVHVKEQVSKILPKIEKFINDQLEAEVLTRSSNKANTSHAVAGNLSELELKKILIDKMKYNKSIDRSIQQKTLYKALVDAYKTD
ncbi:hypothetical protein Tco_0732732 [Tanacetum coccineum]